jgi:hypothetical protein
MTGRIADRKPASKGQKSAEKRRLDDALEEGLEETFPGSKGDHHVKRAGRRFGVRRVAL